ncbi:MAG: ACP S-malonyltransferase, partial [Rhodocyclaceae bacterium]|nr:ACP S-malonyltransferase [Rhodocyclaceae bacterium]
GEVVSAANLNAPGQIVIAGAKAAVDRAIAACKGRGARRAVLLPVSAPFHCELMKPAAEKLQARLQDIAFAEPKIAVVNNVDVAVETRPEAIRDALVRQAWKPVRWTELVQWLVAQGAQAIAECGPGKVLAGMNKRIAAETTHLALADAASLQAALAQLNG